MFSILNVDYVLKKLHRAVYLTVCLIRFCWLVLISSEDQDGRSWAFAFKDHLLHHFYCKLSTATRFIWTRNSRLTSASPNVCLLPQPLDQVSPQHDPPDHLLYLASLHSHFHLKEPIGSSWNILWVFVPWVNHRKAVKHHHNRRGYPPFPKNEIALRSLKWVMYHVSLRLTDAQ